MWPCLSSTLPEPAPSSVDSKSIMLWLTTFVLMLQTLRLQFSYTAILMRSSAVYSSDGETLRATASGGRSSGACWAACDWLTGEGAVARKAIRAAPLRAEQKQSTSCDRMVKALRESCYR